ncbi:MAG: transcriptional regulator [Clostridiales bacterium]|nr:MAG: transcriptional regulator [Clostridiales bacterium]
MKEVMVLSDLEQIKCISQSYRIKILELFKNEKATAKMISEQMGEAHAKINYHIKEMTKHGILELVEEVAKMSLVEKYYQPVARQYVVDSKSMKFGDAQSRESLNQYRILLFENLTESFYNCIDRCKQTDIKLNLNSNMCLTQQQMLDFNAEINKIVDKYSAINQTGEGVKKYIFSNLIIEDEGEPEKETE